MEIKIETEKVAFGGGCFWCTEAVFLQLKGVVEVIPGYAGGKTENPTYHQIATGKTGHAEVVLVEYDPQLISFEKLLAVFFETHDPTTLNRQGNDVGTQYRSVILYTNQSQFEKIKKYIKKLTESKKYPNPIVTEVQALEKFYPAEEYHRKYFACHTNEIYSQLVIKPKVEKVRTRFKELLR
jgi:peptide-methionine (S)-S-oxide reductase